MNERSDFYIIRKKKKRNQVTEVLIHTVLGNLVLGCYKLVRLSSQSSGESAVFAFSTQAHIITEEAQETHNKT